MKPDRKTLIPGETIVPGLTLLFGLAYLIQTRDASATAMRWPYLIAAATGALWLAVVCRYVFARSETKPSARFELRPSAISGIMVIAPLGYLAVMPYLGFALSTFFFLPILFRMLGGRCWIQNLLIALVLTGVLQLALIVLMHMSLPRLQVGAFVL
jgi:hypothetical protein